MSRNANIREWMATKRIAKSVPKRAESSTATHLLENQVSGTRAGENGDKMGKTLLVEAIPSKLALVEGTGGKLIARGEFGRVGTPTDNGRTYPEKLMLREIKKLEPDMKRRRVLGELDHPQDGRTSLKRASHVITSLKIKDGIVIGEAEILGTPEGKILKALIDAGIEVGVSSRGFGSTAPGDGNNEAEVVQDDFSLKTYDFVADPAVRSAVPAIYTEDLDDPSIAKMFMDEFPEIAESLKGGEGALTESADDKDAKALRESVVAELSENFERKLKDALVEQREGLERQLREEIGSDPEIGGAKAVLAAIADLVSEYRTDLSDAVVRDAMKAKELEVAEAVEQRDKALSMAKMAAHGLHIERAISGHPMAESIRKLMLNRTFENVKDVQVALDAILEDLPAADDVVSKDEARVREENAELRGKIALLESKVDELEGRVLKASKLAERIDEQRIAEVKEANEKIAEVEDLLEEAQAKAEKAEERIRTIQESSNRRVEEAKLQAYKLEKVAGLPNGRELLGLMENVQDRSVVDELVEKRGVRRMADESLNQMLDRVKKGKTGSRMRLEEEGEERHNRKRINELGQDMDELSVLAGIQPSID
ncbi:MAG: hypothetical protein PHI12_09180 [Dehalococcoidales bacterium]|nr:hypothetical protein [Dehalococcoidales bacterium]